jgi:anti-anti-sigma regulatory factor
VPGVRKVSGPGPGDGPDERVSVVSAAGNVKSNVIVALSDQVRGEAAAGHHLVTIDLAAVEHITNPILVELCVALRLLARHGIRLAVVGADHRVQWVLERCAIEGVGIGRDQPARGAWTPAWRRRA